MPFLSPTILTLLIRTKNFSSQQSLFPHAQSIPRPYALPPDWQDDLHLHLFRSVRYNIGRGSGSKATHASPVLMQVLLGYRDIHQIPYSCNHRRAVGLQPNIYTGAPSDYTG